MKSARKIAVWGPAELLQEAQRASGADITQTARAGLQFVAESRTYGRLRQTERQGSLRAPGTEAGR